MTVREKLERMGLELPPPLRTPAGVALPVAWVRVRGNVAYVSGHVAQNADGTLREPLGKVGREVTPGQAAEAARHVALGMLGSLERELGDLERVTAFRRVLGMVNAAPGFTQLSSVVNGFTDLILELYGRERGLHARSAVGMAELPFGAPVEVEAEVEIS
jgi:enamine deaminase RidA (YjgF/YER057c/UK114 family)